MYRGQNNKKSPAMQGFVGREPRGFPGEPVVKNPTASAGDLVSIAGSRRSLEIENSKPLQYFCLENSMDRGAWLATIHGVAKSQTRPSTHRCALHASRQSAQTPRENVFVELLEQKGPCHQRDTSFPV